MAKTLLNEIKAMNKIAGTQLTKEQEIKLIKARLNELGSKNHNKQRLNEDISSYMPILGFLAGMAGSMGAMIALFAPGSYGQGSDKTGLERIIDKAKDMWHIYKTGKQLKPEVVKAVVQDFKKIIDKLSPGKRRFMKNLLDKLEKADPNNRTAVVRAADAVKDYAEKNRKELSK